MSSKRFTPKTAFRLVSIQVQILIINAKHRHDLISHQFQHEHKLVNYQCQTRVQSPQLSMSTHKLGNHHCQTQARSRQLSISTQTQACKLSMPNTGTISSAINVNTDTSLGTIIAKHRHDLVSYQVNMGTSL